MSFYPRVELHCHLDGALPFSTFYKLALKEGVTVADIKKGSINLEESNHNY